MNRCVSAQGVAYGASLLFLLSSSLVRADLVLEEIVVTAQKRVQSVQDVPLSITALTQEMLADQNIFDVYDLQRAIPSLVIVPGYNRANGIPVVIRGMGTLAAQPAFEGSVGTYVDGVFRSRPGAVLSSMHDIGRVEVLRGPQGTLFGKNVTAGAISLVSNAPEPEFGYGGELTVGDYDRRRFSGYVTGPFSEGLAGRLSLLFDQRQGYNEALFEHDDYEDLDNLAIKGSLAWQATGDVSVKIIADYIDGEEVCCFGNPVPRDRAANLTGGEFADYYRERAQANFSTDIDLLNLDPEDRENQNNYEPSNRNKEAGFVLDVTWDMGFAELHSITGYRNWQYTSDGDFDFGPVDIGFLLEDYEVDTWSQEFNITGSTEAFAWFEGLEYVTGLFFAAEDYEQYRTFDAGPDQAGIWELFWPAQAGIPEPALRALLGGGDWATPGLTINEVEHQLDTQTLAVFGHVTAALTEKLSLVLGLRYTDEEKTVDRRNLLFSNVEDYASYLQEFMLGGYVLGANLAGPDFNGLSYSDAEWTYDVKLQFFPTPDVQIYGGYSRGFKSGGIGMDPESGGGQPSGQNSQLLLDLVGIGNGTGFADLEDPTYDPEYVDAYELGIKADYLGGRGRLNSALFYNELEDNQFSVFSGTGFTVLNASSAEVLGMEVESFFAVSEHLNLGVSVTWLDTEYGDGIPEPTEPGRELAQAPEWAATINLGYERPLSAQLNGFFNANWNYRGKQYLVYDIQEQQDAYDLWGLQLGVRAVDGAWDVRLWCDNCTDEFYATSYFNVPFYFDDNLAQYQGQFPGAPRTYGATLRLQF